MFLLSERNQKRNIRKVVVHPAAEVYNLYNYLGERRKKSKKEHKEHKHKHNHIEEVFLCMIN